MKKQIIFISFLVLTIISFRSHTSSEWTVDANHSNLVFSASLFGISDIKGTFKIKESTISAPKDDFTNASVTIVIDANSIDTDVDERDKHLRTADYFDTEKYPTASFKSNAFTKTTTDKYTITGELTMHGITKPSTFEAQVALAEHPMSKKPIAGFRVKGIIKRSDYGISPSTPSAMLSDEIALEANLQFEKK